MLPDTPSDYIIERPALVLRREMPIVWVDFLQKLDEADFDLFLAFLDKVHALGKPHVTVLRATAGMGAMSHAHRRRCADWMTEHKAIIEQTSLGLGLIMESAAQRFVLSSILLMARVPTTLKVCANDEEAMAWAKALTTQAGL